MLRWSRNPNVSSSPLSRVGDFVLIFRHDSGKPTSSGVSGPVFTSSCRSLRCFATVHELSEKMSQRERCGLHTRFNHVLDALRSSPLGSGFRAVMGLHCLGFKIGVLSHLPTSTLLLTLYSRAQDLASCLALSHEVREKDIVFQNAVLTALVQNHKFELVLEYFGEVFDNGRQFDSTTLLLVVSALSHTNFLSHGMMVHGLGIKSGMTSVTSLCNALVNMYAKCGDLNVAQSMFESLERRDSVSWNTLITGYFSNNHPHKCMLYFKQMARTDEVIDDISLSCAIAASTSMDERNLGELLHGMVIKSGNGNGTGVSVANSLISMYSRFGDVDAAETVFSEMVQRDIVSWNAMIDGFASSGMIYEALALLREMQASRSVQPDVTTIVTLIPLCTEYMLSREGRCIHGYTVRREMEETSVSNSLIDMYSKCNEIHKAELLFTCMSEQDLISWNTMISAYTHNGLSQEAQILFKEMVRSYPEFSEATILAVLASCDSSDSLSFGKSIHCREIKLGFENIVFVTNSLMNMYLNCEDLATAFLLLQEMSFTRDTASWNTLINGCVMNGHCLEALRVFKLIRHEPMALLNSVTLVGVISACGNVESLMHGKSLHGLALKLFLVSDTRVQNALVTMYGRCGDMESAVKVFGSISDQNLCSINCMVSAFCQNKAGREAIELFRVMEFEPDEITLVSLLPACTQLGLINNGKQLHCYITRHGYSKSPFVVAALMSMYSNLGKLNVTLNVFRPSKKFNSVVTWNSMISSYGFHGQGMEAIRLFDEMCFNRIRPNRSTFTSLLSACSHSGLVEEGLWFYQRMMGTYGVVPVTEHQVCVVDMFGRSGRLLEAYDFIKKLPKLPEPGVWGAMLSACHYHEDMEIGRKVAELLFKLEPENMGYYVSLSNMYVAAGRWTEAVEVRAKAQEKRLKKPPGSSLLDVGLVRGPPAT